MVDCCDPYLLSGGSRLARFSIWTRTSLKYKGSVNRFALPQLWHSIMFYVMSWLWTLKLNVCLFKWIETKRLCSSHATCLLIFHIVNHSSIFELFLYHLHICITCFRKYPLSSEYIFLLYNFKVQCHIPIPFLYIVYYISIFLLVVHFWRFFL